MLNQFISYISANNLFSNRNKLLLAFSGGVDSVVLANLLLKAGYKFELAHCNFRLRGKESEADEKFCAAFAKKNKLHIHVNSFETKAYSKEKKLSMQMAARELRYKWFNDLIQTNKFDWVLTAHHANDTIETLLVNLIRGTGINGLKGIPLQQHHFVRPLLFAEKESILEYAKQKKIKFRHDSSNDEVKYARNYLRHEVIPALKHLNPALEKTFTNNIKRFNEAAAIVEKYVHEQKKLLVSEEKEIVKIKLEGLLNTTSTHLVLHEFLIPYGFNSSQSDQIFESLQVRLPGKLFFSNTHQLLIDRNFLFISLINASLNKEVFIIQQPKDFKKIHYFSSYSLSKSAKIISDTKVAQIDIKKITYPLTVRPWKNGDKFQPLGMKGFKKVSDFLIGIKMPLSEKAKVYVLVNSNDKIIWLIGLRLDERFKIDTATKTILKIGVK